MAKMTSKKRKKKYLVLFNKQTGDMLLHASGNANHQSTIDRWKVKYDTRDPNTEFMATLSFLGGRSYGSGYVLWWQDVDSRIKYPMFLEDFFLAIKSSDLYEGQLTGVFSYTKKSSRMGIVLIKEVKFDTEGNIVSHEDKASTWEARTDMTRELPKQRDYSDY